MKTYSGPAQRIFQGQGGTPRRRAGRGNCMTALSHETVHQADKPWAMRRLTIYPCTRTADSNNTSGECSVCKTRRSVVIHIVSYRIVPHFFSLRQCTAFPLSASHPQTAHALLRSPTPLETKRYSLMRGFHVQEAHLRNHQVQGTGGGGTGLEAGVACHTLAAEWLSSASRLSQSTSPASL